MAKSKEIDYEKITLRIEASSRGGGVEIDLTTLGFKGKKMSAYQNYLGGGMLGRVCVNDSIRAFGNSTTAAQDQKLDKIGEGLKKYFHAITNPSEQEYESQSYEQNQKLPARAY